jgi:hypothetical protein
VCDDAQGSEQPLGRVSAPPCLGVFRQAEGKPVHLTRARPADQRKARSGALPNRIACIVETGAVSGGKPTIHAHAAPSSVQRSYPGSWPSHSGADRAFPLISSPIVAEIVNEGEERGGLHAQEPYVTRVPQVSDRFLRD